MSPLLYYVLTGLVEGPAYTIVDQVEDSNGWEAWRLLQDRYGQTKIQNAIMRIVTIVGTKFHEKNFETTFAQWETEISKFEVAIGAALYPEVKIGLLIAGTTGKIHDHLCLTIKERMDYSEVRDTILNYFKSKKS